ncbi:MAG TPA: alpha/beta-hydrolase family protein [Acidimicrobiia bacterium]|nr:alpha/beta-hydrolase family protein [Acidimicrobiia bacterium]
MSSRWNTSDVKLRPIPGVFSRPVSEPGLITGLVFFILSLLPSLLPRSAFIQGVVSGVTFIVGYAFGAAGQWAWNYLGILKPGGRVWRAVRWILYGVLAVLIVSGLWRHVGWQNNVRDLFGMERVSPGVWLTIVPVAAITAALLLIVARSFRKLLHVITRWLDRVLPARLARFLGWTFLVLILWGLYTGVLVNGFFVAANALFEPRDASTNEGNTQPTSELYSGSPQSLIDWDDLGRQGRRFVSEPTSTTDLNSFWAGGAKEPIRVYVGLKSAETVEERAQLLLEELIRTGAFSREQVIIATTTGTGYLEPNAMTSLDYVTNGDVAIGGVQYSYLPSWISLLADQEEVTETSKVVFDTVHSYWSTLPEAERPEIYMYGLSLGSFGVETILSSIGILNNPIDGAIMVGPPFVNPMHDDIVSNRDPGSTPETPIFEEGTTVRFTNRDNRLGLPNGEWDDVRVVYVQQATDPVVLFSTNLAFEEPDWLQPGSRSDDLTDDFVWSPLVTMWQVLIDLAGAATVPEGYGHLYSKQTNADAWVAVLRPEGMTEEIAADLRDFLTDLGPLD